MHRRNFFALLLAPLVAKFAPNPKLDLQYNTIAIPFYRDDGSAFKVNTESPIFKLLQARIESAYQELNAALARDFNHQGFKVNPFDRRLNQSQRQFDPARLPA